MDISSREHLTSLVLRFGVAFSFLYAAYSGFMNPNDWIGYFPSFVQSFGSIETIIKIWEVVEIILGVWLISGKYIIASSSIATLLLLSVVVFNIPQMEVVFRDISIAAMSFALVIMNWKTSQA